MKGDLMEAAVFCLATGAAMGCIFLLFKVLRILLNLGKLGTAGLDVCFCLLCSVIGFLCALALDRGRFRFFQAGLQALGGVCVILVFDPFLSGIAKKLHGFFCFVCGLFRRLGGFLLGIFVRFRPKRKKKQVKSGKKLKKARKNT